MGWTWEMEIFSSSKEWISTSNLIKKKQEVVKIALDKQIHIIKFLNDLVILKVNINGLSIIWDTQYKTKDLNCPRKDPLCESFPLERFVCKCRLIYSISSVCINLARYELLEIEYKKEKIVLTPTLLLDYGLLGQVA